MAIPRTGAADTCSTPPSFTGVTAAVNAQTSTCGVTLSWNAATKACGGAITYTVYRGANGTFVPSAANRLASQITTTSFTDVAGLTEGQTYWYIVRATETAGNVVEESNTTRASAAPTSPSGELVHFSDDFDGNRPTNADAYWHANATSLTINTCDVGSPTHAYWFGATTGVCTDYYPADSDAVLVLGGDGTTPGINGFDFPSIVTSATLSFYQNGYVEGGYDFVHLRYSTSGANGPWTVIETWTGTLVAASRDVKGLAGHTVWFSWEYVSDSIVQWQGAALDDVLLSVTGRDVCTTGSVPSGSPDHLRFDTQPSATVAGAPFAPAVMVGVYDALGNLVVQNVTVHVALGSNPSNAVLLGTAQQTSSGGLATFTDIAVDKVGQGYSLYALVDGLSAVDSVPFNVGTGTATALAFIAQPPPTIVAGQPFSVQVALQDSFGNVDSASADANVALALSDGTLASATSATTVNGIALFSGLSVAEVASGLTLQASGAGFTTTSTPFAVVNASTSTLTVTLGGPAYQGQPVSAQVTALDALGNIAKDDQRTVVVTSSDAKAQLPAPFALYDGRGAFTVVFGSSGTQSISVADSLDASIAGTQSVVVAAVDAPTVTLLNPRDGDVVSGQVNIIAAATVGAGTAIDNLTIRVDGQAVGTDTTTVVSALWDTSSASDDHVITAEVTDQAGNSATSTPVHVSIAAATGGSDGGDSDASGGDADNSGGNGNDTDSSSGDPSDSGGGGCAATETSNLVLAVLALAWLARRRVSG